jgi:hypothetical protein
MMDKQKAADRIRTILKARIARILGCEASELPEMKIGSMAHFLFLTQGDGECMGGFNTTMSALNQLIGFNLLWDVEPKDEKEESETKVIIN